MSAASIAPLAKMIETLPDPMKEKVIEHLRDYIGDLQDESRWDVQLETSQSKLADTARKVSQEITEGLSKTMDLKAL